MILITEFFGALVNVVGSGFTLNDDLFNTLSTTE